MTDRIAGYKLLETGSLVNFDILETDIQPAPGGDETVVRIEMHLGEVEVLDSDGEEEALEYRSEDWEWGSLGFIFCLAVLSFHDARPRGVSGVDFEENDEFSVADLHDCLRYERGELRFRGDYIRGRSMKTDITVRPDGRATLETRNRGEAVTRWVQRLKGKKVLEVVQGKADGE